MWKELENFPNWYINLITLEIFPKEHEYVQRYLKNMEALFDKVLEDKGKLNEWNRIKQICQAK